MDTQNVQTEEREKRHLSVKEICEIIPHRHPFLLVDYIEDYEPGEFAVGYKCVTYREDFCRKIRERQHILAESKTADSAVK